MLTHDDRIVVVKDYAEMSRIGARIVVRQLIVKPNSVLGLPTGKTPAGLYNALVATYRQGLVDLSQASVVTLDEFCGLSPADPRSFRMYIHRYFLDQVNVPKARIYVPSAAADPDVACAAHDRAITELGGIDLQVLGIGCNGHLAFNEPGTQWNATTQHVALTPETRHQHRDAFGSLDAVPTHAITVGIRTIMRARHVLLLAAGQEKAEIVAKAVQGPVTPQLPASILQLHPVLTIILDRSAAKSLLRD